MAAFTVSLSDRQIESLARGREIPVDALPARQRQSVETFCVVREGDILDSVGFMTPRGVGPAFQVYVIRTRDGKRMGGCLYGFPLEWREAQR